MIVDIHAHLGDLRQPGQSDLSPITVASLIGRLDEEGIDRAVVLPWPASPEAVSFPGLFDPLAGVVAQIEAAAARPDRLVPFANADPRWGGNRADADFAWFFDRCAERGCRGLGEVAGNLPFDDPRVVNLFHQAGARGWPVLIESCGPGPGRYGLVDEPGSPRLDRLLGKVPETIVIGHGPGFWAEIGAGLSAEEKSGYPSGPIAEEGSLWRLLSTHRNLYADISAQSGWNALTRDPQAGLRFVRTFADRLLFGTDTCFADAGRRAPQLAWLRALRASGAIDPATFDAIAGGNACRLLSIAE